jgi:hypothetical protein
MYSLLPLFAPVHILARPLYILRVWLFLPLPTMRQNMPKVDPFQAKLHPVYAPRLAGSAT